MEMSTAAVWISLAACVTIILGLLLRRERHTEEEALWRGEVNGKLDIVCGIRQDVETLKAQNQQNARDIAVVDASARSAHRRIDELARMRTRRAGKETE